MKRRDIDLINEARKTQQYTSGDTLVVISISMDSIRHGGRLHIDLTPVEVGVKTRGVFPAFIVYDSLYPDIENDWSENAFTYKADAKLWFNRGQVVNPKDWLTSMSNEIKEYVDHTRSNPKSAPIKQSEIKRACNALAKALKEWAGTNLTRGEWRVYKDKERKSTGPFGSYFQIVGLTVDEEEHAHREVDRVVGDEDLLNIRGIFKEL
ncbi:MAG: hypothetical protein EBU90_20415 [Proteobacteria bacterium]|nr:hypothetical protein [Pseudomonadota bacterium]